MAPVRPFVGPRIEAAPRVIAVVIGVLIGVASTTGQTQDPAHPTTSAVDDARIETLIRKLGDPSYDTRTQASRELCRIGHRAAASLERASGGKEFEIALRAANLLELIDSVYFGGCVVRLSAEPPRIVWDQSLELIVTIRNESDYPAQIPLELSAAHHREVSADARQVGDMVDLADYLRVTAPDGRRVELKTDDILVDAQVADAVEWRVEGGPLSELPPGGEAVLRLRDFNRGWARYPLLAGGVHKIVLEYDPQWDDEEFRRAGVGRVRSAPLEIEVTEPAPAIVRHRLRPAVVTIERAGGELVARLTNSDDLPIWVNTNWGSTRPPFAQLVWTVFGRRSHEEEHVDAAGRAPIADAFRRDRLVELVPGGSVELGRVAIASLLETETARNLAAGQTVQVRAALANQCDRSWQQRQEPALIGNQRAPQDLRTRLPRRMLTGRFPAKPIELTKPPEDSGP